MVDHLYALDATNLVYRYHHAFPYMHDGATYGLLRALSRVREAKPSHVCAVLDGPGPTFRHKLLPSYKGDRGPRPEAIIRQGPLFLEAFKVHGIASITSEGIEADDVMASLTASARREDMRVTVVSADKDLTQLLTDPGVSIIDPKGWAPVLARDVEDRFGVPPALMGDLLALAGDSGDGVPGVDGVGRKIAAALLQNAGGLGAVVASAHLVKGKRGEALRKAVQDGSLELYRQLVGLVMDAPLPPLPAMLLPPADHKAVRALCLKLGFRDIAPPDWPEGF